MQLASGWRSFAVLFVLLFFCHLHFACAQQTTKDNSSFKKQNDKQTNDKTNEHLVNTAASSPPSSPQLSASSSTTSDSKPTETSTSNSAKSSTVPEIKIKINFDDDEKSKTKTDDEKRTITFEFDSSTLFKDSKEEKVGDEQKLNKDKTQTKTNEENVEEDKNDAKDNESSDKIKIDLSGHLEYMTQSILNALNQQSTSDLFEIKEFESLQEQKVKDELEPDEELSDEELIKHHRFRQAVIDSDYETLFKLADEGHLKSQEKVLYAYLFGKVPFDLDVFVQRVLSYSSQGNAVANMFKGFLYSSGLGVEMNQAKSLVYMSAAAFSGDTFANMALGYRYLSGVMLESDCETSLKYYQMVVGNVIRSVKLTGGQFIQRIRLQDEVDYFAKSSTLSNDILQYYQHLAEKGNPASQVVLGQLYLQGGRGVKQDVAKAISYFMPAAEEGNANAMAYLGKIYYEIYQDYQKAYKYFNKSAILDNSIGQGGLGIMYLYGKGLKQDYAKAYKYLSMSALNGWAESQFYVGIMYLRGYGVSKDYKNAVKYFMLASQAGNVLAIYHLALMHVSGKGTLKICRNAGEMFKSVAERGQWTSLLMDAYTDYREGRVVESYFKYSFLAELGYEVAQSNAATILDRNELKHLYDQKETFARAFKYWQRSAAQGYSVARVKLGDYHYYGQGTKIDLPQAAEQYRIAAEEKSCAQAFFNLGYMYEQGVGLPRDLHLAKRYYDLAEKSSSDARLPVTLARIKLFWIHFFENSNIQSVLDSLREFILTDEDLIDFWEIIAISLLSLFLSIVLAYRRLVG